MPTTRRPIVIFGAAFLATVTAALFTPLLLLFITLPCGFALIFLHGRYRSTALIVSLGCLAAVTVSGLFFVRLSSSRAMVGTVQQVSGSVFYENGRQLAVVTTADGNRLLVELFPTIEGLKSGDGVAGTVAVTAITADDSSGLLSGGLLLSCMPEELVHSPGQPVPLSVQGVMLRERLCNELRSARTDSNTTVAILFSVREYMPPELRAAFAKSGMSHLLAVSGLHLSILVWTLASTAKRLGGSRWLQALIGSGAALFIFLAAGMGPSVFRATVMTLLTLMAGLASRKSDGLTSLALAAIILVAIAPPVVTSLSFLLSFASAAGILLLASPLYTFLEQLWVSRFSRCGRLTGSLLSAISVSVAAQLATAPVVAYYFGSLPLLGIAVNLIAIPLVYPVLILGFAASLCVAIYPAATPLLLQPTNLCSSLLEFIAGTTAQLPLCTLPILFPSDLLPLIFLAAIALCAALFPYRIRLLQRIFTLCTVGALLSAGANAFIAYNSVTVASSSVTGSLAVTSRGDTLIVDNTRSSYHRTLDMNMLSRMGTPQPDAIAFGYPYDTAKRIAAATAQHGAAQSYTAAQLAAPTELLPGIWVSVPQPYVTEIAIGNTKVMKFYATYDTIEENNTIDSPDSYNSDLLLADRQGNLLSLGARQMVLRRGNGESFVRIYKNGVE